MFIFVLAKNVLLCHFILFAFSTLKFCNYWTSQTVDSKGYSSGKMSGIFFLFSFVLKRPSKDLRRDSSIVVPDHPII